MRSRRALWIWALLAALLLFWLATRPPTVTVTRRDEDTASVASAPDPAVLLRDLRDGSPRERTAAFGRAIAARRLSDDGALVAFLVSRARSGPALAQARAWALLEHCGPDLAGALAGSMDDANPRLRWIAVRSVLEARCRGDAFDGPSLRDLLEHGDPRVRAAALRRVARGATPDEESADALLARVRTGAAGPADVAAFGLARMGSVGVTRLASLLDGGRAPIALRALAWAPPAALRPLVPRVAAAMEAGDEATRLGAVAVLRAADAADEVTLPALDGALTSGSPAVRRAALRALADLGPRAAPLAGRVAALLDHEDPWVGEAASAALAAMRLPVTRLEALLSAAVEQRASERAARELGGLGPAVAPAVLRLFGSPDPEVRDAALLALPGLGAAAAPAVPGLRPIVESGTRTLRERALRVAAAVGPRAAPLVPALLARLGEQRGPSPRLIAALEAIGEPAHEPLLAALRSPLDRVRMDALTVLSRFRHGARFALGALPPFSRSRSPRVRELVAVAAFASVRRTGEDGPPPPSEAHVREARALLERLAGDEDAGVRRVAGYGLQALERLRGR